MIEVKHLTKEELEVGLEVISQSPKEEGSLEMIVRRPDINEREVMQTGELSHESGLVGDNWRTRPQKIKDSTPDPNRQLNIMNSRVVDLIAQQKSRWPLAGDQLYIDFDMSEENVPAGTQLAIGTAIVEVTPIPHLGCKKFVSRFGLEAMKFVNSEVGKKMHLRGVNARVVKEGVIRTGDVVRKL